MKPCEIHYFGELLIRCRCGWEHHAEQLAGDTINERLDAFNAHRAGKEQRRP